MSDAQQIADMYFEELREHAEREGIDAALHVTGVLSEQRQHWISSATRAVAGHADD